MYYTMSQVLYHVTSIRAAAYITSIKNMHWHRYSLKILYYQYYIKSITFCYVVNRYRNEINFTKTIILLEIRVTLSQSHMSQVELEPD